MTSTKQKSRHPHTRIWECILGLVSQELATTKRAIADPTRAALPRKCPPAPGPQCQPEAAGEQSLHPPQGRESLTPSSGVEVKRNRKTTTGCCFLMRFISQQRKRRSSPQRSRGLDMSAAGAGSHNSRCSGHISAASCSQIFFCIDEYILCSLFPPETMSPCLLLDYHLFKLTARALEIHGRLMAIV